MDYKVLFPRSGSRFGGSTRSTDLLIEALADTEYRPIEIQSLGVEEVPSLSPRIDILVRGYLNVLGGLSRATDSPKFVKLSRVAIATTFACEILRRTRADIVHTNEPWMHWIWGTASMVVATRHVWHHRTREFQYSLGRLRLRPDQIIAISEHARSTIPSHMLSLTRTINNPFEDYYSKKSGDDLQSERRRIRHGLFVEHGIPIDPPLVGYVANLKTWKRPLDVPIIANRLRVQFDCQAHFVVVGESRDISVAELRVAFRRQGVKDTQVHLLGPQLGADRMMAGFDVLLATAEQEPFGRTLIEAMLQGTPVVASDSGGHREAVKDGMTGLLFSLGDAEMAAKSLSILMRDEQFKGRLSESALSVARQRYLLQNHVEGVLSVYEGVLNRQIR